MVIYSLTTEPTDSFLSSDVHIIFKLDAQDKGLDKISKNIRENLNPETLPHKHNT